MRKVFLDNLPRKLGIGANYNKLVIDWKSISNITVKFVYDNIEGEIMINNYDNNTRRLSLNYLDIKDFKMHTGHFIDCKLKELLSLKTIKYKYDIGSIIENKFGKIKILSQIRMDCNSKTKNNRTDKGYIYECLSCGNVDNTLESHIIEGKGCNICCPSPQKIVKGINDVATTHPHLIKYFVNVEDAYMYSHGSKYRIKSVCDRCGYIKNIWLADLTTQGFSCPKCGDGISYPNKFIFNIFEQLNINFSYEETFDWSIGKRYDFYIPQLKCILEAHGEQHYKKSNRGRSLQEEQENDKLKEQLAKENKIEKYIVVDCRHSDLKFIKNNILNSELVKLFDLSNVDWLKCHEFACNTLVKIVCDLWNDNLNILQIASQLKLSRGTVFVYLKRGLLLNWCNYKTLVESMNENMFKIIELWENGNHSTSDIGRLVQLHGSTVCRYLKKSNELGLCDYTVNKSKKFTGLKMRKAVLCLDNNLRFDSVYEVEKVSLEIFKTRLLAQTVRDVCKGNLKYYKGYHFEYTL